MSDKDLEETLGAMRALTAELIADPEKARAFLVKMGIHTPDGELTEQYK